MEIHRGKLLFYSIFRPFPWALLPVRNRAYQPKLYTCIRFFKGNRLMYKSLKFTVEICYSIFVHFLEHCCLLGIAPINQSYIHVFGFLREIDWCTNH